MEALELMVDEWITSVNAQYEPGLAYLFAPEAWPLSSTRSQWELFLPQVMRRELEIDPIAEEVAELTFIAYRTQGEPLERELRWELTKVRGRWMIQDESWRSP
jgi:hypothetical protein